MENKESIQNLSLISQYIGNRISDVQGGGGNTSVKYDNYMAVKSSGCTLKDLSINKGFSVMNLSLLKTFLNNKQLNQSKFDSMLGTFTTSQKYNRPSMEAGLHASIDYKYVAHTHSVYVNVFTCSLEGRQILSDLFPESLWVNYSTPGLDLYKKFHMSITKFSKIPKIIFLQNHGLFICSDDHKEIFKINELINKSLINKFNLKKFLISDELDRNHLDNLLFPDQAVYLEKIKNINDNELSIAAKETISVVNYLINTMESINLNPNFLTDLEQKKLHNMESEKYRKQMEK